jgi:hypothetical protein
MALTKKQADALSVLETEVNLLAKSRKIQTDADRALVNLMIRIIETELYGEPKTVPLSSHHV